MTEVPQTEEFSPHQKSGKAVAGTRALKRTLEEANNDSQELYTKDRLANFEDEMDNESPGAKCTTGGVTVLDEIELHFKRSLSQAARRKLALEESSKIIEETSDNPTSLTCNVHRTPSSGIPLYVCSGNDVCTKDNISSISSRQEDKKLKLIQSPVHSSGVNASPLSTASARPHIFPTLPLGSMSPGTSLSPTTQFPLLAAPTGKLTSQLPQQQQHCNSSTSAQTLVTPVPPGSRVQVIDIKNWTNNLPNSPVTSNLLSSASPMHISVPSTHPVRLPKVVCSASNVATGKIRLDNSISNNGTSPIPLKADVQVASNGVNPIMLLPTSPMMVQPQPFVIVSPSDLQQVNVAPILNSSSLFPTSVPEVLGTRGGGNNYVLLSSNPVVQVVSAATTRTMHSAISKSCVLPPSPQPVTYMNISTKTLDPFSPSGSHSISRNKDDSIGVMPASVEDHFAKALGDQWSKLNTNSNVSPQSTVIS